MKKLCFKGEMQGLAIGLERAAARLGFQAAADGLPVQVSQSEAELSVCVSPQGCRIGCSGRAEFFRALSLLLYGLDRDRLEIREKRAFSSCGVMLDVSRNAVLKPERVKDWIERMALMGLDTLLLYMEDTYQIEKYPYFGYMRGAYSQEELRDISEYGDVFGVEVIPCIQTLAHLKQALRWPYAKHLRDTEDILLIDEPETYALIEEMFRTLSGCFSSKKIHVGMDEAACVGLGNYLGKNGYQNRFDLLLRHLNRVKELADRYGLELMMWSDMFFRLGSKSGEYYDPDYLMPDGLPERIPDGVTLVYWDYYGESEEVYREMFARHRALGARTAFAGGSWTWQGICIGYEKTFAATRPALSACRSAGVTEVTATLWGDHGSECSVYAALLGMQLFAEYNYSDTVSGERLSERFRACTGYDMEAFLALDFDQFPQTDQHMVCTSKQVLFQDVLQGLFDRNFENAGLEEHYDALRHTLAELPPQKGLEHLFEYHRQLAEVLRRKCTVGIRLTDSYRTGDTAAMRSIAGELRALLEQAECLHELAAKVWYENNKPFGFDRIDLNFGGLEARIRRAAIRVEQYLSGEIPEIGELEEKRLWYNGGESPFVYDNDNDRIRTVSQS